MKYILITVFGVLLAVGLSTLIVLLINRKRKIKTWLKAIIIPISSILLLLCFDLTYFAFNYSATERAKSYLKGDDIIDLNINNDWYYFDNKANDENAIIFYSGGKVDPRAYSELCSKVAHSGIDVYLIKMPLYFPLLNMNAANKVASLNKHENLYMMGHSLGGTTASLFLANNDNPAFKGIIFLASYPNSKLNDSLRCLSIYGTNDQVLNKSEYNKNHSNFPNDYKEIIIEGGNHSGFADYGPQRNDGIATISNEEQIDITKSEVCNYILNS